MHHSIASQGEAHHTELKFNAAGMGWKAYSAEDNSDNITYAASDIESAAWHRGSRHFTLRLQVRSQREGDGGRVAFEGFKRDVRCSVSIDWMLGPCRVALLSECGRGAAPDKEEEELYENE